MSRSVLCAVSMFSLFACSPQSADPADPAGPALVDLSVVDADVSVAASGARGWGGLYDVFFSLTNDSGTDWAPKAFLITVRDADGVPVSSDEGALWSDVDHAWAAGGEAWTIERVYADPPFSIEVELLEDRESGSGSFLSHESHQFGNEGSEGGWLEVSLCHVGDNGGRPRSARVAVVDAEGTPWTEALSLSVPAGCDTFRETDLSLPQEPLLMLGF